MTTDLRPGSDFADRARGIRARERARLTGLLPRHELLLVGGSSVPGALTKGDVDLHLRVPAAAFDTAVARLREIHAVVHPEIWQPTLATFTVEEELPTGLAVTPAGSAHDLRFTRSWQLLAADPALLGAYNEAKLRHRDDPEAYERAKSALFDLLLRRWPDHPAGGAAG
jgi:GrpB-like predicted nucleotidyltransferase (UPF0157 family)